MLRDSLRATGSFVAEGMVRLDLSAVAEGMDAFQQRKSQIKTNLERVLTRMLLARVDGGPSEGGEGGDDADAERSGLGDDPGDSGAPPPADANGVSPVLNNAVLSRSRPPVEDDSSPTMPARKEEELPVEKSGFFGWLGRSWFRRSGGEAESTGGRGEEGSDVGQSLGSDVGKKEKEGKKETGESRKETGESRKRKDRKETGESRKRKDPERSQTPVLGGLLPPLLSYFSRRNFRTLLVQCSMFLLGLLPLFPVLRSD